MAVNTHYLKISGVDNITIQYNLYIINMEAISARVRLVNGNFHLPNDTIEAMREIRSACSDLAMRLEAIAKSSNIQVDVGRMIAAVDLVQQVKDVACVAVILPHSK